jgi:ubiquinone/menaquinone biosynthesis C-methylase UbiE/pimeloyl-ACP methyl ester carboxylesterase
MQDNGTLESSRAAKAQEQRKHTRVRHSGSVVVNAEGGTFAGSTVNISRSGMQLVVNMPASYREIRSISFTLPSSTETLETPCRLVRAERNGAADHETLLGVEINWQTEAQMLLIENFIRDSISNSLQNPCGENRVLPRSQCAIEGVSTDRADLTVLSINNISSEGLLLRFRGELETGDALSLEFPLPGDSRRIQVTGRVLYVIENVTMDSSAAGIAFQTQSAIAQARIKNFIVTSASGSAIRGVCEGFTSRGVAHEYRITNQRQIRSAFRRLQDEGLVLNSLFEGNLQILELKVADVNHEEGVWTACRPGGDLHRDFAMPAAGFFSFCLDGGSHYFKSEFFDWSDGTPILKIPQVLFRSEKRSYQRKPLHAPESVSICLQPELAKNHSIQGRVLDISRHGFLCEVPLSGDLLKRVHSGKPLKYSIKDKLGLSHCGEIRHFTEAMASNGDPSLRIGVEAGVVRDKCSFRRIGQAQWKRKRLNPAEAASPSGEPLLSEVVRYRNEHGQELVGLVNRTGTRDRPSPVVIIPPAFGKKKEATAALAATLIANFRRRNNDLVVLRYDGINRPGESSSEEREPKRGYEMLRYRIAQGNEDLKTTIDFVYDNPYFRPEGVALISSSMSALDCRRFLALGDQRVHFWVSLMGVPAAQTVLLNTLGGLDIIGNARMGIPNGMNGLLGYLVDMDLMARDLIDTRCAYLADARQDFARISLPVLWIYGTYDRWISSAEVWDILSVKSGAGRELLEIPTGHNLRSSEDAIHAFQLITSWLYRRLHGKRVIAVEPDRDQLFRLIAWERERLLQPQMIQTQEYWKSYLIGAEKSSLGYDFYRNLEDFRSFLAKQAELLRPEDGGRIADLGCGTGLMVEHLLERAGEAGQHNKPMQLTAVDLVPEALERTRQKWLQASRRHPRLKAHSLECLQIDLAPNRMLPVQKFMDDPDLPIAYLQNRVQGLSTGILESLEKCTFPRLRSYMAGEPISEQTLADLQQGLGEEACAVVLDFNRVARFLNKQIRYGDLISPNRDDPDLPIEESHYDSLRSSDLRMARLSFGSCARDLQLPFPDASFDKLIASLFISYLPNPDELLGEFFRILKPGGLMLSSSMKPDSDISEIFTSYIGKVRGRELKKDSNRDRDLNAARNMLNEASSLFQLEEDGYFRFYTAEELRHLVESAGFAVTNVVSSMGNPPQAVILTAYKPA